MKLADLRLLMRGRGGRDRWRGEGREGGERWKGDGRGGGEWWRGEGSGGALATPTTGVRLMSSRAIHLASSLS